MFKRLNQKEWHVQGFTIHSIFLLFAIASVFLVASSDAAYAQPLDEVTVSLLESKDSGASVQFAWIHDDTVSNYEVGCVSCIPNFSEHTSDDKIILQNVSSLENGLAIFYIIAYDDDEQIMTVKQLLLKLYQ